MKHIGLIILLLFAFSNASVAQQKKETASFASFEKTTHDFGKITEEKDALTTFKFVNNTDQPLVLNPPKTSCGCTTPKYPKKPIAAGEEAELQVKYSTKGRVGKFIKDIKVYAQGYDDYIKLQIKGEVVSSQEVSTVPKKEGGSLFK